MEENLHKGKSFKYKGAINFDGVEYDYCKNVGNVILRDGRATGDPKGFKGVQNDFAECVDAEEEGNDNWMGLRFPVYSNLETFKGLVKQIDNNKKWNEVTFVDDEAGVTYKMYNCSIRFINKEKTVEYTNATEVAIVSALQPEYI